MMGQRYSGRQVGAVGDYISIYGVPEDWVEAARWYRLAAEQGLADVQNSLGMIYFLGRGVPEDYVLAYMWMNLA
jgi:TPR repeat protein